MLCKFWVVRATIESSSSVDLENIELGRCTPVPNPDRLVALSA
jgi:hypothetical protein